MEEPKPLDSIFKEKIFRIPDYQRGYAWQLAQLKDFWEDLINLSGNRSHYTGVLTLKEVPSADIAETDKEYWLVEDHSYRVYHIVDGQQRLTTFVIFLQAFVDFVKGLPENIGKSDDTIYINDSLSVSELRNRFLYRTKPTGDQFRTYKFGYTEDNPSYEYLRFRILGEDGGGSVQETFYTLNLCNAKNYFAEQFKDFRGREGMRGLHEVYRKLTKHFLFNEYVIRDAFDVFVAFETMNNRGKKLSDLELLKNRLIYLTTLYSDEELDPAERKSLRDSINDAWKEVYHQLGRNKRFPLNDDEFLRAHWTMYFKYSRKTSNDYIRFLLEEQFTPKRVHKKVDREVRLEQPHEQRSDVEIDDTENEDGDAAAALEQTTMMPFAVLEPTEMKDFVNSLKESAVHWFNSYYPELADGISEPERQWLDRLNRVGMVYFRPLVMAILKSERGVQSRIRVFGEIERFIFIVFRTTSARANYRSSEFYNLARAVEKHEVTVEDVVRKLHEALDYVVSPDGILRINELSNIMFKKFAGGAGPGYYGWYGLRYFLYEYELSLLAGTRQKKVDWSDLLKSERDRFSIEHIYPQTESTDWSKAFASIPPEQRGYYGGSLGNLLLLSRAVNSALQNDGFIKKKQVKHSSSGEVVRNGYADGSHSEIEVSRSEEWGPEEIRQRGLKLLRFMERRWRFRFTNEADREQLLFLPTSADEVLVQPAQVSP